MASPLKFRDVETFLPSFAQVPGSLRDALDPAPSLRCVDTGRQQQPSVPSPRQLQLDASRARKQTARGWACARAQELQHVTELPEIEAAVLPQHLSFLFDDGAKAAENVSSRDFFQKDQLQQKMNSLSLSDHFDSFGKARFRRLGLAYAAKQMMPQQMAKYSSISSKPMTPRKGDKSAKTFILSQEALNEDNKRWTEHTKTILDAIQETDRYKDQEVKGRQVAILFAELPKFLHLLPSSVPMSSLEVELNREEDPQLRWLSLRQNSLLRQPVNAWRFRRNEVLMLLQVLKAWTLSSWPRGGSEMGMDRSSFCRFVVDVGLVDQHKVPYFWAVNLFDSLAKNMRFCPVDDAMLSTAPLVSVVTWWELFPILEHLAGQFFKISQTNLRVKFIEQMAEIARFRLPSFAQKVVNISKEHLELMHQGVGLDDEPTTVVQDDTGKRNLTKSRSLRALTIGNQASKAQATVLEEAAKQRHKSLLAEPEVLQLLWQHEVVFQRLHKAYCDNQGHMNFAAVVQLCSDFSLAPKLISLHALRKIYESLEALDIDIDDLREWPEGMDMTKAKSLNPTRTGGRQAGRRSSISTSGSIKPQADASPASSVSGRRASLSIANNKKRSSEKKSGDRSSPSPSGSLLSSVSLKRRSSMQATFGTSSQERTGLMLPWEAIAMRLREAAKSEPCSGFLRVPALMELLCKVAFSYLGCYGNMQQRSMSTLMQSVWLLVYIRFTVESVRSSLQRRDLDEDDEDRRYGALGRAASSLSPELWKIKAPPSFEDLPLPRVRPVPREVVRQTAKQSAEAPQEGTAYVVDQRCQICKSEVATGSWGNARCYGCSKIDSLSFRHHPLASLLRKGPEKPVALAGKVPRVRNTSLSPVPFQANDILALATEDDGSRGDGSADGGFAARSRSSSADGGSFAASSEH